MNIWIIRKMHNSNFKLTMWGLMNVLRVCSDKLGSFNLRAQHAVYTPVNPVGTIQILIHDILKCKFWRHNILVGVYSNTISTTFLPYRVWSLTSFFQTTSKQTKAVSWQLHFHVYVYPFHAVWKLDKNQKFKLKVVFIVLIYTRTTK